MKKNLRKGKYWVLDEYKKEAVLKHGNKFDYSKVELCGANGKIVIGCPEHGDFKQTANGHLRYGCYECNPRKKKTTECFIREAKQVHGDKFDYSLVEYVRSDKKVKIICPTHGVFEQEPVNHLSYDCSRCQFDNKILSNEAYVEKCKKVHGDRYDYSKVEYKGAYSYVVITCSKHGDFEQQARIHVSGFGCKDCAKESISSKNRKTTEQFIASSEKIHGKRYNYSLVEYVHSQQEVVIGCEKHGNFLQKPKDHIGGSGCSACGLESTISHSKKDTEYFIEKARSVHGDLYDYSKSKYIAAREPIEIVCKYHGSFWQRVADHYISGCSKCGNIDTYSRSAYIENSIKNHNGLANLYFIQAFDDLEEFYKIGISVYSVEDRFSSISQLPYDFHILFSVQLPADLAWDLETHLHKFLGRFHYKPICNFGGYYKECFKSNVDIEMIVMFEIQNWLSNKIK